MNSLMQKAGRHADLVAAGAVVLVVVMMIVPLPAFLLDLAITLNISAALMIVVATLYVPRALDFSAFPSLLLLTTLFRLAINVSVTRLILLHGDAGHVVTAFGNFVVGGNVVVGLIIFLILVVIQFVVITNGAGRVAEVGARFTLDAMPGKQMAIDADLNTGQITDAERVTRMPVATEISSAGICAHNPSPTVSSENLWAASPKGRPCWATPMTMPPTRLISVIRMPAMASPLTNFDAPSIAP